MADKPKIPAPPWTEEALGEEKYCELALAYGIFDPRHERKSFRPSLGLTELYEAQEAPQKSEATPEASETKETQAADAGAPPIPPATGKAKADK